MEGTATRQAGIEAQLNDRVDDLEVELESADVDAEDEGLTAEQRAGLVSAGQAAIVNGVNDVKDRLGNGIEDVRTAAVMQQEMADAYAWKQWEKVDEELGLAETLGEDSQVYAAIEGTFTRMVSAAVTLIVGIYVFAQIGNTMPAPENPELANASDTVMSTTGNAFTLGAVAIIVLVASVILGLVGGFGGRGRGRR